MSTEETKGKLLSHECSLETFADLHRPQPLQQPNHTENHSSAAKGKFERRTSRTGTRRATLFIKITR